MKRFTKLMAVLMAGGMFVSLSACGGEKEAKAAGVSYVGIDVNPSITLVLDKNEKVVSVTLENEDAQILMHGEASLVGLDAEKAAKKIAELCVELGYLDETNAGVSLSVEGKEGKLQSKIEAGFESAAKELSLHFTADGTFSLNRELSAWKAEFSANAEVQALTAAEYKLIASAMAADQTLSFEAAVKMNDEALIALINEAASVTESYATAAYEAAYKAANVVYENAKGQLLDACWLAPYANHLFDLATGKKVHYGMIYNLYTSSARALDMGIQAAEAAKTAAENVALTEEAIDGVIAAMGVSDEVSAALKAEITAKGNTLYAVESALNKYYKNMTKDAYEAAKAQVSAVMEKVQAEAEKIDAAVRETYGEEIDKFVANVKIPDELKAFAGANTAVLNEFKALLEDLGKAMDGKEPIAAAYAALKTFQEKADGVLKTMKADLTEDEVKGVEETIASLEKTLETAKKAFDDAVASAKKQAEDYLAAKKAERKAA